MFLKIIALLLCITYATCQEYVQSYDCANTTLHSRNVQMEVSGCKSTDERCPLYRGHNHTVVFTFEPTSDFTNRTDSRVYGVFEKFSVPYGKKTDACEPARSIPDGTTCVSHGGFRANRTYKHSSNFAVSANYPMLKLKVRFTFYDRRSKLNIFCKELKVEIQQSPNTGTTDDPQESNEA